MKRGLIVWVLGACLAAFARSAPSAPTETISVAEAVRLALARSPAVAAAQSRREAAVAGLRKARAPYPLQMELAPGAGQTNGNALLAHRLDIGGRRPAAVQRAAGERAAATAALDEVRTQVAADTARAYFDLARAWAIETATGEAVSMAQQMREAVRKRVALGEAPEVQTVRADIEVARLEQDLTRVRGAAQARRVVLHRLLGRSSDAALALTDAPALPARPSDPALLVDQALRQRFDLAVQQGLIAMRRGEAALARAAWQPELVVEVAADTWSLDRNPFRSRDFGMQFRLSFPLVAGDSPRADMAQAQAALRAQEADQAALRQQIVIEVEQAAAELAAARDAAAHYQATILPRTDALLQATRAGFETGLTSYMEVLEAQRVARQTRIDYETALFDAIRARIALDEALGQIASPASQPGPGSSSISQEENRDAHHTP